MAKQQIDRLVFVFNADSGRWNAFVDSTKKLLMVDGCALCSITHGLLGEKGEWNSCKESLGVPIDYVHRNEIHTALRDVVGNNLPCIVAQTGSKYVILITPEVLERCRGSVSELKGKIEYYCATKDLALAA